MRFTLSKIDRLGHQKSYIDLYKSIINLKKLISKNRSEYKTDSLEILIKNAELELDLGKTKKEYRKALNGYKESKKTVVARRLQADVAISFLKLSKLCFKRLFV